MSPEEVTIYTDGACSGNPGPGGYGVVLMAGKHRKELSGGFRLTTNNRMELLAAITGLEALKYDGLRVKLHTDSQYLVNRKKEESRSLDPFPRCLQTSPGDPCMGERA